VTTSELRQLVEGIRFIEKVKENPVDKDALAGELKPLRDLFTKSVVARRDLAAATVLREEDLTVKKPGTGIPAARLRELVRRKLRRPVNADAFLSEDDLE
jgi:N-acetylneuraminate synthase